ncbi:conserved hypothetical protein [Ricinus communis]|uniref:Uncharacterized protein n=1 Tax=Ricinus communis TaxID=3988 RepID=B9TE64_RICCO|nr:conserved hypothetical protein [Ricinus communis]
MCTAAGRGWLPRGYLREKPRPIRAHEHAARAGSAGCVAVRSRRSIVCGPGPGVCAGGAPVGAARPCRHLASTRSAPAGHRRGASRGSPRPLGGRAAHDLSRSVSCPAACTTGAWRTAAPANHGSAVAVRICLLDCALCRTRADRIGILRPGFGSACTAGGSLAGAGLALCIGTGCQRAHAALLGGHAAHRRPPASGLGCGRNHGWPAVLGGTRQRQARTTGAASTARTSDLGAACQCTVESGSHRVGRRIRRPATAAGIRGPGRPTGRLSVRLSARRPARHCPPLALCAAGAAPGQSLLVGRACGPGPVRRLDVRRRRRRRLAQRTGTGPGAPWPR